MMLAARKVVLPPPYETSTEQLLRGDHAIYNKSATTVVWTKG